MKLKNFFFTFFVAVLALGFSSCGDDDDDMPPAAQASIVGTWSYAYAPENISFMVETNYPEMTQAIIEELISVYSLNDPEKYVFRKDGTHEYYDDGKPDGTGTYIINNDLLMLTYTEDGETSSIYNFEFTVQDDTLTLTFDDTADYSNITYIEYFIDKSKMNNGPLKDIDPTTVVVKKVVVSQKLMRQ